MDSVRDTPKGGLPHSEIFGSKPARGSPKLIAACHVLHRLSVPRHPPDALQALDPQRIRFRVRVSRTQGQNLAPPNTPRAFLSAQTQPSLAETAGAQAALGHVTCLFTCQTTRPAPSASLCGTRHRQARRSCVVLPGFQTQTTDKICPSAPIPSPPNSNKPLVEADGIEPTTSCLQSRRSPN